MNARIIERLRLLTLSCAVALLMPVLGHGEGSIAFNGGTTEDKTSKLQNTDADLLDDTQQLTVACWINAESRGEGNLGYVFVVDDQDLDDSFSIFHYNFADDTLIIAKKAETGGTTGIWTIPVPDGSWNGLSVTLDFSQDNSPTARVNSTPVTVTPGSGPVDIEGLPDPGYCVGNNAAQTRTWDGKIAHVQVFNRILSAAEQDACLQAPGSVKYGLRLWLPMRSAGDTEDQSGNDFDATATDVESGSDGPIVNSQQGIPAGTWQVPVGINSVEQYVLPRYANGESHPAGQIVGHGPGSAIQGTTYGPTDGSNPQEIVVTEDWNAAGLRQWDNGPATIGEPPNEITLAEAVIQPGVKDVSILGKVDLPGYINSSGELIDIINDNTVGQYNPRFPHGDAIRFNGSTSFLMNDSADVLDGSKKVTVCCWVNPDSRGEQDLGYVIVLDEDSANAAFLMCPFREVHIFLFCLARQAVAISTTEVASGEQVCWAA